MLMPRVMANAVLVLVLSSMMVHLLLPLLQLLVLVARRHPAIARG